MASHHFSSPAVAHSDAEETVPGKLSAIRSSLDRIEKVSARSKIHHISFHSNPPKS